MTLGVRIAVVVVVTSIACAGGPAAPDATNPTIADLRAAPLAITIDNAAIELRASLWRDFMPTVPPPSAPPPLIAAISLSSAAAPVTIDRLWVLFGAEMWEATPERVAGTGEWIARGGPAWAPGSRVDVVARVRSSDGRAFLVRAADRPIEAVS